MARLSGIEALLARFGRSQRGAVAVAIGIAVVPMMLAAGVAVDYVHASVLKTRLQTALDAAALAAAAASQDMNNAERIELAESVFTKNWEAKETKDIEATPAFTVEDGAILGSAEIEVPTALMRIVGIDKMPVGSDVTISIPKSRKAEVVLVLDYSRSMTETSGGEVKYIAMRDAASKLVSDLEATAKEMFKIGIVPFSHQVYLTLPEQYVLGQSGSGNWTGCTVDRKYPHNITDDTPTSANGSKWGQAQHPSHIMFGCSGYAPRNLEILPLTDDFDAVKNQLAIMQPYEYTHIALGAEFGWHVLSPNAPFTGSASYSDKQTQKIMVLLTDGRQTEPAFGSGGARSVGQGEKNLEKICSAMKDKNITIVTVAFDLQDVATRKRLRDCATDPDKNFFVAEDDDEVAKAFNEIKTQIAAKIFISK